MKPIIEPLGDMAVLATFGNKISNHILNCIQEFCSNITTNPFSWMVEMVPAYTSVAIYFDPLKLTNEDNPYEKVKRDLESLIEKSSPTAAHFTEGNIVRIPVCYGGDFGPDLLEVASHNNITPEDVVALHSGGDYLVHMIGFQPGFPYLGGMTEKLATPRRKTPRLKIPAGSVGIAGGQTGVYPLESPGGWQIIGRTPMALFCPEREHPSLLKAGDRVRFYPISIKEFSNWDGDKDDH